MAEQYGVTVTFAPKFHCECNAIEGLWAHQKQYIRRRTDQTYPTMTKLIEDSRINFIEKDVAIKLLRRFWRVVEAYHRGDSFQDILTMYFSSLSKTTIQQHRRTTNSNLDD